jgi:hypothetical protein
MTNGEKMKADFPDIEMWGESNDTLDYSLGGMVHRVTKKWWYAEYKEPTTKNELGVKLISKEDALDCVNWGYSFSDIYKKISDLPLVTPIKPKGYWIEEFYDEEGEVRFTCSNCRKYQLFGTDFCYHCGSDNREVEK